MKCYPQHPQSNPCETYMNPLGKALKAAYYHRDSAQAAIDELLKAYRSTPHPATHMAPGDMMFRQGYLADFPKTQNLDETELTQAETLDKEQKNERKEKINASRRRVAMTVQVGDKVLLKRYPKGRKFEPVYDSEVYEVVGIEEKGVTVKGSSGKMLRRHKDDIKIYFRPECVEEEEEVELPAPRSSPQSDSADQEVAQPEEEEQAEQLTAEALPAEEANNPRPQRERKLPGRLRDFVVGRLRMSRLGNIVTSGLT